MESSEFYWFAGIVEGEGAIFHQWTRGRFLRLYIRIRMTDEDVVRRCRDVAGIGSVNGPYQYGPSHWKPQWAWEAQKHDEVVALLTRLLPLMGERRKAQIQECLTLGAGYVHYDRGGNNREKTHCKRGHPFDEANTYVRPDNGGRQCRECSRHRHRLLA